MGKEEVLTKLGIMLGLGETRTDVLVGGLALLESGVPMHTGRQYMLFFFSSRRRHTRCSRDWSSDVCSSDLDVSRSEELFERAKAVLPGGVNSPVRAFRAVGGTPFFVARAEGSRLTDVDGRTYLDYVCSWGPLILGHAHPAVLQAIRAAAERGWTYGAPCEAEGDLAEAVRQRMPAAEMV